MNVLSLFAGIGGLDLGLERAGMTCVGQVEIDPYCREVLAKHWPKVPRHDDVRTTASWWQSQPRPAVHVIAGGFPCQPVSTAGRGLAQADPRWLWPAMLDVITAVRPDWVIGENVSGLRTRGLAIVLDDLRRAGYAAAAGSITACAMGAPHPRQRLFILAHPDREPTSRRPVRRDTDTGDDVENDPGKRLSDDSVVGPCDWWATEPDVGRVADGLSSTLDKTRLKALGNAVVPQVAEHIGRLILASAPCPR